jgi:hypothetical protein
LETNFSHLVRVGRKLLYLLDCEPYANNCGSRLICHFELDRCMLRMCLSLYRLKNLLGSPPNAFVRTLNRHPLKDMEKTDPRREK